MRRPTRRQRFALILLVVLAAGLITADYQGNAFTGLRNGAETVFGPVQRGLAAIFNPIGRFLGGIPHLGSNRRDIDALRKENDDLRRQLAEQGLDGGRATELTNLKLLAGLGGYRVVPATVVSLGPSLGFEWTVTIDVGSVDGVKPDMTVVSGPGLVGRVKDVGRTTSVVVLAADPGSIVGTRVAGSNELGLVTGNGTADMSLTLLNPNARVRVGDRLVTGPYGESTYVAGVPIGEITAVGGDTGGAGPRTATVRGYVDPTRLDLVGVVLTGPRTDPRDSVLPPRPTPSGTPTPSSTPTPGTTPAGTGGTTPSNTPSNTPSGTPGNR
jgi:rod shape-determining protein MreC